MIRRYGIDTSVLVSLITGEPEDEFDRCVRELRALIEGQGDEVVASNQVVGEAYVAVRRHYGVSGADARAALIDVLTSGLVAPLNGRAVMEALEARGGPGLFDRLVADDYSRAGLETLTLDRGTATLADSRLL